MSDFQPNEPIWVLDDDGRKAKGIFLRAGEPDEAKVDPKLDIPRDAAWVETERGEIEQRFYRQIAKRNATVAGDG